MIIVVHASDCKAIQCNPIAQQSAKIVAIRPAQRDTIARLVSELHDVNHSRDAVLRFSRQRGTLPYLFGTKAPLPSSR